GARGPLRRIGGCYGCAPRRSSHARSGMAAAAERQPRDAGADQGHWNRVVNRLLAEIAYKPAGTTVASEVEHLIDHLAGRQPLAQFGKGREDSAACRLGFTFKLLAGSHCLSSPGASLPKHPLAVDGWSCRE